MTDQQLAEAPESEVIIDEAQTEVPPSETVSEPEAEQEKPVVSPEQKAAAENAFKAREAKRETEAVRRELESLKAQIPKETRPDVPELQEFADAEEMQAWQTANTEAIRYDERQRVIAETQQAVQQQQAQAEQVAFNEKVQAYSSNAEKLGVKPEELQQAGGLVSPYLRQDLVQAVLDDEDGPLVTVFLSANPEAIDSLNNANMLSIGQIYADIKAKAATLKPKQSQAPEPAEVLTGGGAPKKDTGPEGATYE